MGFVRQPAGMRAWGLGLFFGVVASVAAARPVGAAPKFFFNIVEVDVGKNADAALPALVRELLAEDLKARPEFATDVDTAGGEADLKARLAKRGLKGFGVTLKLEEKSVLRPPRPGGRLKVLVVGARVALVGAAVGDGKLAFSGDGEAEAESEILEERRDKEIADLRPDVVRQALRQAVDQAIARLAVGKSRPIDEARGKRKRSPRRP